MANRNGFVQGACASLNRTAKVFREAGHPVKASREGCPPSAEDILASISKSRHAGPRALVLFHWEGMTYQFDVPASEIRRLRQDPESSWDLFSVRNFIDSKPYRHFFYLAANNRQQVVVHHRKLWMDGAVVTEETRIVEQS